MNKKYKIQTRKVQFEGSDGSLLAGNIDFPEGISPVQYVIVSHCFTCTRQTLTTARLSRGLVQAGFAVLRFDLTGLGDSEGSFADSHFRSMIGDIERAAEFLSTHYQSASLLIGHSMGGTASLAASQSGLKAMSHVDKIITLASPAYPAHVLHHFGKAMTDLQQGKESKILVAGQPYPVKPSFINDVESYDMDEQMKDCVIPIMAARAGKDSLVGPEAAERIINFTAGESRLYQIDEADHLFSNRDHAEQLLSAVLLWINK